MAVTRKQKHIVVSPSIFGGTQKSSFIINFSGKCESGASFIVLGPKLRAVALLSCNSQKMAKIRGEHQKTTSTSETHNFSGLNPRRKWQPQVYWWYAQLTKIVVAKKTFGQIKFFLSKSGKKMTFGPNIKISGIKFDIFSPGSPPDPVG